MKLISLIILFAIASNASASLFTARNKLFSGNASEAETQLLNVLKNEPQNFEANALIIFCHIAGWAQRDLASHLEDELGARQPALNDFLDFENAIENPSEESLLVSPKPYNTTYEFRDLYNTESVAGKEYPKTKDGANLDEVITFSLIENNPTIELIDQIISRIDMASEYGSAYFLPSQTGLTKVLLVEKLDLKILKAQLLGYKAAALLASMYQYPVNLTLGNYLKHETDNNAFPFWNEHPQLLSLASQSTNNGTKAKLLLDQAVSIYYETADALFRRSENDLYLYPVIPYENSLEARSEFESSVETFEKLLTQQVSIARQSNDFLHVYNGSSNYGYIYRHTSNYPYYPFSYLYWDSLGELYDQLPYFLNEVNELEFSFEDYWYYFKPNLENPPPGLFPASVTESEYFPYYHPSFEFSHSNPDAKVSLEPLMRTNPVNLRAVVPESDNTGFIINSTDALNNSGLYSGVNGDYIDQLLYSRGLLQDFSVTDYDNDGLSYHEETQIHNTDPNNPDSDQDGMSDGMEVKYKLLGFDPNSPSTVLMELLIQMAFELPYETTGITTASQLMDGSISTPALQANSDGTFDFTYTIKTSEDLINWSIHSQPSVTISPISTKQFLRIHID